MSDQLSLDIKTASQLPAEETIDTRSPDLTPEQNADFDRLVESGVFNPTQAFMAIGALPVAHETRQLPTQVGPFIVKRDGLPERAHFGAWKNTA